MNSSRLPGKVLKTINGRPLISLHLDRLSRARSVDKVIVASSNSSSNRNLITYLEDGNVPYFEGSESDVLSRFYQTALAFGAQANDLIIRVTSDCPLICADLIDQLVSYYQSSDCDYARIDTNSYPRGFDAEIFTMQMLEEANNQAKTDHQREHVTPFFYQQNSQYKTSAMVNTQGDESNFRLCVDEAEDFQLMSKLVEAFPSNYLKVQYRDIINYLEKHPELTQINQHIQQH